LTHSEYHGRSVRATIINDITERKRAEKALLESEERYRKVVEDQTEIICRFYPDNTYSMVNNVFASFFGKSKEELIGRKWFPDAHPDDVEMINSKLATMSPSNPVVVIENRALSGNRNFHWMQFVNRGFYDQAGNLQEIQSVGRDITERKRAEEALLESEKRYQLATSSGNIGVWDWNIETDEIYLDPNLKAMLGYEDDEIKNHMDHWFKFVHPDDMELVMKEAQAHLDGLTPKYEIAHRMMHKDGSVRWFLARGNAMRNNNGKPYRMMGTEVDITLQKQAETEVRESEKRFRILVEAAAKSGEAIIIHQDRDGKEAACVFTNDAAENIIGYSKEELGQLSWFDFMHPRDRDASRDRYRRRMSGEIISELFEITILTNNGTEVPLELASVLTSFQGKKALVSLYRDISQRKRMEDTLRKSEQRYRTLFENSRDPIYFNTREGRFVDINQSFLDLFGYTREEMARLDTKEIYADPENRSRVLKEIDQKGFLRDYENLYKKKNGTEMECLLTATVRRADDGSIMGYEGVIRDITERKRLVAQLQQSQKMEAIATLAGGIAHQFNNALSPIMANLDLLRMDYPDNADIKEYIDQMMGSTKRMARLTNQLLAYARGGKYQAKIISPSDFVRDTLPLIRHTIHSDVDVETDLPRDNLPIKVDFTQMQMVLTAVLQNASEASKGEGRIKVSTRTVEIDEASANNYPDFKPGSYVSLTIEDDGMGMDEETKNRIFEPFFTTKFQGRGLGMAAAYGIVKNHDGRISVDSELGKGTIVRIYLPATEVEVKERKKPKIEPSKGAGTILVIEDEEMVMDVSRAILEKLGYRVLGAKTGKEAINIAETFDGDIDLAVLDIVLPDMGGKEIYPLIMEARPYLKVLVCSGYSIDGPAQEIIDAGADDFLQKPFSVSALSEKLADVMKDN